MENKGKIQERIFSAMLKEDFYDHPAENIEVRETHISMVFLAGGFAYKIKKPLNLGFLDFTSLEKRKHFCEQEVLLNRRLAQDIYLGVTRITLSSGEIHLESPGETIEYAVKMRRLPQELSLGAIATNRSLTGSHINLLAKTLSHFYGTAEIPPWTDENEHLKTIEGNCEENFSQTRPYAGKVFQLSDMEAIVSATRGFLQRKRNFFVSRIKDGRIRDCHGDLRPDHIYFTGDETVQIIDCIEFSKRFRVQDSASDLAFLAMELELMGLREESDKIVDRYVEVSGDMGIYTLINFYKCYRAFVRCKVTCMRLNDSKLDEENRSIIKNEAGKLLDHSLGYAISFSRPFILVLCGMPASGKSHLSSKLSRITGVKHFNSDRIRKEIFQANGCGLKASFVDDPEKGIYSRGATSLTYGKMLLLAQDEIKSGKSVILDATFSRKKNREEVIRLAENLNARLLFTHCRPPDETLKQRLRQREKEQSISDARISHFSWFKETFDPFSDKEEKHLTTIDSVTTQKSLKTILTRLFY